MEQQGIINQFIHLVIVYGSPLVMPLTFALFFAAVTMRLLIYFTISREHWFAWEFDKRVKRFLDSPDHDKLVSFFLTTKLLLERTYYEVFEVRAILKRRKPDAVRGLTDRLFLIQHGCARLVKDTQQHIRYLKHANPNPQLLKMSQNMFENNPCFNKVFGVLPTTMFNDFINILPGIFIVFGIFGTFLGIMQALPDLGNINLRDYEATKIAMDDFLIQISYSMGTSIVGIVVSVVLTFTNNFFAAEKLFAAAVQRYEASLDLLWQHSSDNRLPEEIPEFDEHRDPLEALAEDSVRKWAAKTEPKRNVA